VRRLEPSGFTKISALGVEEQRVNAIVEFNESRSAWQNIGDGYRVEVRIIVWSRDDVVRIPASSLFRYETKWAVFRVENGIARRRVVEIGHQNGVEAEVVGGLAPGDRIVVYPSDAILEGVRVTSR
jgi:HlyD family secretion protein